MLFSTLLQQPQFPSLFLDPEEEQILGNHPLFPIWVSFSGNGHLFLFAGPDPEEVLSLIRGKDDSRFCLITKAICAMLYLQKLYFTNNYAKYRT